MSDTKTYKVLRPIGWNGDRLEKGATVNLTDEEAKNIGPDVELVGAQTEQIDASKEESTGENGSAPSEDEKAEGSFENDKPDADASADDEEDSEESSE